MIFKTLKEKIDKIFEPTQKDIEEIDTMFQKDFLRNYIFSVNKKKRMLKVYTDERINHTYNLEDFGIKEIEFHSLSELDKEEGFDIYFEKSKVIRGFIPIDNFGQNEKIVQVWETVTHLPIYHLIIKLENGKFKNIMMDKGKMLYEYYMN